MSQIAERIAGNGNASLVRLVIAVSSGMSLLLVSIISWNASGALKKLDDTHDQVVEIKATFDGQVKLYSELRSARDREISDLHSTQVAVERSLGEIQRRLDRVEDRITRVTPTPEPRQQVRDR